MRTFLKKIWPVKNIEVLKDKEKQEFSEIKKNKKWRRCSQTIECEILNWVHIKKKFTGIIDTIWNSIALMLILQFFDHCIYIKLYPFEKLGKEYMRIPCFNFVFF